MSIEMPNSYWLHVPKTGGSWVKKVLTDAVSGSQVIGRHVIRSRVKKDKFTFAFVRHPLEWYRSYWCYKMGRNWARSNNFDKTCRSEDFKQFIRNTQQHRPGEYTNTCNLFLGTEDDPIDFIGRYENLTEDLVKALNMAGEEVNWILIDETPPVNTSPSRLKERAVYDEETAQIVYDMDRSVFERFGYEFKGEEL